MAGVPGTQLKPGTEERVEEWRSTIASRLDEAAATLKDEDVQVESWFTTEIGGEKYLLWYMRAGSIKRVFELSQPDSRHLNERFFDPPKIFRFCVHDSL